MVADRAGVTDPAVVARTAYVRRPVGDPPTSSDAFDWTFDDLDGLVSTLTAT